MAITDLSSLMNSLSQTVGSMPPGVLTTTQYNIILNNITEILGTGEGDYGYGQEVTVDPLPTVGTVIIGTAQYNALGGLIRKARSHQTGSAGTTFIKDAPSVTSNAYIKTLVKETINAYTFRLNTPVAPSQATLKSDFASKKSPSALWNGTSTHSIQINFETEDNMRWFFNSGGSIQFAASRVTDAAITTAVSVAKNSAWTKFLKSNGNISFGRSKTVSSANVGNTTVGYASLLNLDGTPSAEKVVFSRSSPDKIPLSGIPYLLQTYVIKAQIVADENGVNSNILFTILFTDGSTLTPELNVSGTLQSDVRVFRATGTNVEVPLPLVAADSNTFELGDPTPSYRIRRSATTMKEDGTTAYEFEIIGQDAPNGTLVYWSIVNTPGSSGVTIDDFVDRDGSPFDSIVNVQAEINNSTSGIIYIVATADLSINEGFEKFNFVVRSGPNALSTLLTDTSSSLTTIQDTSRGVAPVPTPQVYFKTQTVSTFKEGEVVLFNIGTKNATSPLTVRWVTEPIGSDPITKADFKDNLMDGAFQISPNANYILRRPITPNDSKETIESFAINLLLTGKDGIEYLSATSDPIKIIDDTVIVPIVPPTVLLNGTDGPVSIGEKVLPGVIFTVNVPDIANNVRMFWKIVPADDSVITADDFSNTYTLGGTGLGGTIDDYIVVQNKQATLKRYATTNLPTEPVEKFYVAFYKAYPLIPDNWVVNSPNVSITESVTGYGISSTPTNSVVEGSAIEYTVTTPYMKTGKLFWYIPTDSLTITATDFESLGASFDITNSTGRFTVRPNSDKKAEGIETFKVQIRDAENGGGTLHIESPGEKIVDPEEYTINSVVSANEGDAIVFNITTPFMLTGVLFWSVSSVSGNVTNADFSNTSRSIPISNSSGTVTLNPILDNSTEGDEEFRLVLSKTQNGTPVFTQLDPVRIKEDTDWRVTLNNNASSIAEGTATTVRIYTPWATPGTPIFWEIVRHSGNITATDFLVSDVEGTANKLKGKAVTALVTSGSTVSSIAAFTLTALADGFTEGTDEFKIAVRFKELDEPIFTSPVFSVTEVIPFRIILPTIGGTTVTRIDENDGISSTGSVLSSTITLQVTTPFRKKGTPLYWKVVNAGMGAQDFNYYPVGDNIQQELKEMYGICYVSDNNTSEIQLTANPDNTSEANMNFKVELRELPSMTDAEQTTYIQLESYLALSGTPVAVTSVPISITDTSGTPDPVLIPAPEVVSVTPNKKQIFEGGTVTFDIKTKNFVTGTELYWDIGTTTMLETEFLEGMAGGPIAVSPDGNASVTITTVAGFNTNSRGFLLITRIDDPLNNIARRSIAIPIVNLVSYSIEPEAGAISIVEGSSLKFYVTAPANLGSTTLTWHVIPQSGSTVTQEDFSNAPSLKGTVGITINSDGTACTGNFTLTTISTDDTEGKEYFTVTLASSADVPIDPVPTSPVIAITESVSYGVTVDTSEIYENPTGVQKQAVEFKVSTPAMSAATTLLKYQVIPVSGSLQYTDFVEHVGKTATPVKIIGDVSVTKHNDGKYWGTFTLTANPDSTTEGAESFTVKIFDSTMIEIKAGTIPTVTINEVVNYEVSLTNPVTGVTQSSDVMSGTAVTFYISTPAQVNKVYWRIKTPSGTALTAADFFETTAPNKITGNSPVTSNKTKVVLTPKASVETRSFSIEISALSETDGWKTDVTVPVVNVVQPPDFVISGTPTPALSGQTVTFTITYPGIVTGNLFWKIIPVGGTASADFTLVNADMTGSFTGLSRTGGTTTLPIVISSAIHGPGKSFTVQLSLVATPFVKVPGGESNIIVFGDPADPIVAGAWALACDVGELLPNKIATYTLDIPSTSTATSIYWKIVESSALNKYFALTAKSTAGTTAISGNVSVPPHPNKPTSISIVVTTATKFIPAFTEDTPFTIQIHETNSSTPKISVDSPVVNLIATVWSISPNGANVSLDTGTTITVMPPSSVKKVYWKLSTAGSAVPATWFTGTPITSGNFNYAASYDLNTFIPVKDGLGAGKQFVLQLMAESASNVVEFTSEPFTMPVKSTTPPPSNPDIPPPVVSDPILSAAYTPNSMSPGAPAVEFTCKLEPPADSVANVAPTLVSWVIEGTKETIAGLTVNNQPIPAAGGTINAIINNGKPVTSTAYGKLPIAATLATAPGTFTVTYKAKLPGGDQSAISSTVTVGSNVKHVRYSKIGTTYIDIVPGTKVLDVILSGGGGQGGGMSNAYGGNGSNGDLIKGTINIPTNAKRLKINIVPGGLAIRQAATTDMGKGGAGGAGVELFIDDTYVATAAGGGGGGGGAPLPYPIMLPYSTTKNTVEIEVQGKSTSTSLVRNTSAGQTPTLEGHGAGGYPGGTAGSGYRNINQVVYIQNNSVGLQQFWNKGVYGGTGGISTIAAGFPSLIIVPRNPETTSTELYRPLYTRGTSWRAKYAITSSLLTSDAQTNVTVPKAVSVTARWENLTSTIPNGTYILRVGADNWGWINVGKQTYDATNGYVSGKTYTITLDNTNWDGIIVAFGYNSGAWKPDNPFSICATLRPADSLDADTSYIWTTRSLATVTQPTQFGGAGGKGGAGIASSSVPPSGVAAYSGGAPGVPKVDTGYLGDSAYFEVTMPYNGLSGFKEFTSTQGTLTFNNLAGVTKIKVVVIGAGGGGGIGYDVGGAGVSGAGGGCGAHYIGYLNVDSATTATITIGKGGKGGAGGPLTTRAGEVGGDTTFKIVTGAYAATITSKGGKGGDGFTANNKKTIGGNSGTFVATGTAIYDSEQPRFSTKGEDGFIDGRWIDVTGTVRTVNNVFNRGGMGASSNATYNGIIYGNGGKGGDTFESGYSKPKNGIDSPTGFDGAVFIFWGPDI